MTNGNDDLETVKTILVAVARRAEATDERLDQLIESQGRTQKQLDQLSVNVDALGVKVDSLREDVDIAFQTIGLMAENGDRDRAELREEAAQDRAEFRERTEQNRAEFQAEVLRIWEYLRGQRNGNGDGPQR